MQHDFTGGTAAFQLLVGVGDQVGGEYFAYLDVQFSGVDQLIDFSEIVATGMDQNALAD